MAEHSFERWYRWSHRNSISELEHSGVYLIAISKRDIQGQPFAWIPEIVYVGMTNALSGLRGRLKQFDNTILGKTGHGGAQRFRHKHPNYATLSRRLFVTVSRFPCNVKSVKAADLRVMGSVAAFEYECLARFYEIFGGLPEFNDKKRSPKSRPQ
jgi:hypothetical protein